MGLGNFYGIGIGPGDPGLMTVKAAGILGRCKQLIVPKAKIKAESLALDIAKTYLHPDVEIHELVFPMTRDKERLAKSWHDAGTTVAHLLEKGDACFITLGDAFLYSTYNYLVKSLREILPEVRIETVPGITSFSAAAALTSFSLGESKELITIVPMEDDLLAAREAILRGGTVILMKIGKRLPAILELLLETNTIDDAVLVQKAGQPEERIELDLRALVGGSPEVGYLSIILIHAHGATV